LLSTGSGASLLAFESADAPDGWMHAGRSVAPEAGPNRPAPGSTSPTQDNSDPGGLPFGGATGSVGGGGSGPAAAALVVAALLMLAAWRALEELALLIPSGIAHRTRIPPR
jgi:hypothetical protein